MIIREKRALGDKKPLSNHNYLKTVYQSSKQIFAQTSTVSSREKQQVEQVRNAENHDDYFKRMQQLGVDIATLPGGADWLKTQGDI
ncbi:hypothetical protein [Yersinia pseudotuberculosis]|uniref:hypothetical protein n=1 Tax=Yersinia pseudotuberculosis TaxID=633 RepID=UPI0038B49328